MNFGTSGQGDSGVNARLDSGFQTTLSGLQPLLSLANQMTNEVFIAVSLTLRTILRTDVDEKPSALRQNGTDFEQ